MHIMRQMYCFTSLFFPFKVIYDSLNEMNRILQCSLLSNNSPCSTLERGNQSRCTQSNERILPSAKHPPTKLVWLDPQTTRREEMNHQSSTEKQSDHYKDRFRVHLRRIMTNFYTRKVFVSKLKPNFIWTNHQKKYTFSYSSNICKRILHLVANTVY